MLRFTLRRLLHLVPILLGLSILLFFWLRALPGGPAQALLGERATPARIAEVNRVYGLDQPVWQQYLKFLWRALHLDLGVSTRTQQPVTSDLIRYFPATIELGFTAIVIAVVVGVPLGYAAARRHLSFFDSASVSASLVGVTIPVFFLAFILKYVFGEKLGWLPTAFRQNGSLEARHPTNFYLLDGLITGNPAASLDALQHLILPAVALATIPLAIITRITRAAVLDVVHEDYVRTAEAKGLTTGTITRRHVLRNALLPVVTVTGLQVGLLLSGAVLTETVFAFQGVGSYLVGAIAQRDYAVIQGGILVIAVVIVLINLLVDLSYGLIDPRARQR